MGKAVLKKDVPVIEEELLLTNTQQTCDQGIQSLRREKDTENFKNISNKKKNENADSQIRHCNFSHALDKVS